ncbi:hypothetical protein VNI00_002434 [Paramarasmius palmivorus]|uniref:Uncharacterized protein n=1 Tax=Paramarasmius palmivorus TaxID=297713 RepID=A0AAW0DXX9_9AGAR
MDVDAGLAPTPAMLLERMTGMGSSGVIEVQTPVGFGQGTTSLAAVTHMVNVGKRPPRKKRRLDPKMIESLAKLGSSSTEESLPVGGSSINEQLAPTDQGNPQADTEAPLAKDPDTASTDTVSQDAHLGQYETQPNTFFHEPVVYHPPHSLFPIRICSVYGCGVILTKKDGDGPVCGRHQIGIEMIRRGNPYPVLPGPPPQPPTLPPQVSTPYQPGSGLHHHIRVPPPPIPPPPQLVEDRGIPSSIAYGRALRRTAETQQQKSSTPRSSVSNNANETSTQRGKLLGWTPTGPEQSEPLREVVPNPGVDLLGAVGKAVSDTVLSLHKEGLVRTLAYPPTQADIDSLRKEAIIAKESLNTTPNYPPVPYPPKPQSPPRPRLSQAVPNGRGTEKPPEIVDLTAGEEDEPTSFLSGTHAQVPIPSTSPCNPYFTTHLPHLGNNNSSARKQSGQNDHIDPQPNSAGAQFSFPEQTATNRPTVPRIRTCTTPGCTGLIKPDSTAKRCHSCIIASWKSRKNTFTSVVGQQGTSQSTSVVQEKEPPQTSAKENRDEPQHDTTVSQAKKRKSVTWADGWTAVDGTLGDIEMVAVGEHEDEVAESHESISGWDSDLTELETSESSNSECDQSDDSETSSDSDTPLASKPVRTGFKIRIPARPRPLIPLSGPTLDAQQSLTPSSLPRIRLKFTGSKSPASSPTPVSSPVPIHPSEKDTQSSDDPSRPRCVIKTCNTPLPTGYTWKCCPGCRAHHREYQRKRLGCQERYTDNQYDRQKASGSSQPVTITSTPIQQRSEGSPAAMIRTVRLPLSVCKVRGPDVVLEDPENLLVPQARLCTIRTCKHILPAADEYKWKMCHPCRERSTRSRKLRRLRTTEASNTEESIRVPDETPPEPTPKYPGRFARCIYADCGIRLDPHRCNEECGQCRWRQLPTETRKLARLPLHDHVFVILGDSSKRASGAEASDGAHQSSASASPPPHDKAKPRITTSKSLPLEQPRPSTPYPEYPSLSRLLTNFQTLLSQFLQVQSYYTVFRGSGRPAKFCFDGEYSAVAADLNVMAREQEVTMTVTNVMHEIERVGHLKFEAVYPRSPSAGSSPDLAAATRSY